MLKLIIAILFIFIGVCILIYRRPLTPLEKWENSLPTREEMINSNKAYVGIIYQEE